MRRLISFLFFLQVFSFLSQGADYYVSTTGSGIGTNWSTAYTNIQTALNTARSNDTIYLAGRSFNLSSALSWTGLASHVAVHGGYAATNDSGLPGNRDINKWETIITRPSGSFRLLNVTFVTNGTIEGVRLTKGSIVSGSTHVFGGAVLISNCVNFTIGSSVLASNQVASSGWHAFGYGGGIAALNSSVTLTNNLFTRNQALANGDFTSDTGYGGGIYVSGGVMYVFNCRFAYNIADNAGSPRVGRGGGASVSSGSIIFRNCLFHANRAYSNGDGLYVSGGTVQLNYCTVARHSDDGIYRSSGTVSIMTLS